MGRAKRRQIVMMVLGMVMVIGIALHFRLWAIDSRISSNDTELLRREFDHANREAMDESAEWRRRYDFELEKSVKCHQELEDMKRSLGDHAADRIKFDMEMLQKENKNLHKRIESLKLELEAEKARCRVRHL